MTITPELRQAIERAGGDPVLLEDPETKRTYVLIPAEAYQSMHSLVEAKRERQEEDTLLERSRRDRLDWIRENPY